MWRTYSSEYIRRNRASSISITAAAFIASLFLSLLCSLFFNVWVYEIQRIILEEGDWQARITGTIDEDGLAELNNFANVDRVVAREELSQGQISVADVYVRNMRTIYEDMPAMAEKLGLAHTSVSYHELLLSRYMVYNPHDENPPLLPAFCLFILTVVAASLVLIIHNAFAVSMNARIHQFGIFSSVGASPGQILVCLMQEAAVLCAAPVLLGNLFGIGLSFGAVQLLNRLAEEVRGRHGAAFQYHPLVFGAAVAVSGVTVLVSAWLSARKLSKMTALEAIGGAVGREMKKRRRPGLLALLGGIEGELAANALWARRKALRTSTLSLTLSFMSFTVMLCFFTLSGISTDHTYFARYQDAWDVMVTVKNVELKNMGQAEAVGELPGVVSSVAYQKEEALCVVPGDAVSRELRELGGLEAVAGNQVTAGEKGYFVQAPIIVMDDRAFAEYCRQIGITPEGEGTIVLNQIWDNAHSNFRYRSYVPFVRESQSAVVLQSVGESAGENTGRSAGESVGQNIGRNAGQSDVGKGWRVEVPVLGWTQEAPALREEYDDYALVQFLPVSLWEKISEKISEQTGGQERPVYIRILSEEKSLDSLRRLEREIQEMLGGEYETEVENRVQEKADNDNVIKGFMVILGAFCCLLALIGIANVFSNTLSFLYQRKEEFARYMSVGMTPASMRKMFCVEALVIAGRPLLVTFPVTVVFVWGMIRASYLEPAEFLERAPVAPAAVFAGAIFVFVGLAYYVGGRRLLSGE